MDFLSPQYGSASLSDVAPSLLAAMGVEGFVDVLGVSPARAQCLLLVDGLGWDLLQEHADCAPTLSALAGRPITAGFPTTTASSIASVGTGVPSGQHGIVGYGFRVGQRILSPLTWRSDGVDMREVLPPEEVQPLPTVFERAAAAGVGVHRVEPREFDGTGFSRAANRGATVHGTHALGDMVAKVQRSLSQDGPQFVYAYHADVDLLGHVHGPGSLAWRVQLRLVDQLVDMLLAALPTDAALAVVADHGMVGMVEAETFCWDTEPVLQRQVRTIAGDVRARQVYLDDGADPASVAMRWQQHLGAGYVVLTRQEVIGRGWYGPQVTEAARHRMGDLLVLATALGGLRRSHGPDAMLSGLPGQHGSLTSAEQRVPFLFGR